MIQRFRKQHLMSHDTSDYAAVEMASPPNKMYILQEAFAVTVTLYFKLQVPHLLSKTAL